MRSQRTLAETLGPNGQAVRGWGSGSGEGVLSAGQREPWASLVTMASGDHRLLGMCVHLVYLVGACSPGAAWLSAVTPRPRCLLLRLRMPRALESGSTSQPFPLLCSLSLSLCVLIRGSLQQIRSNVPWARSPSVKSSPESTWPPRPSVHSLPPPLPVWPILTGLHRSPSVFALHLPDVVTICKKGFGKSVILSQRGGSKSQLDAGRWESCNERTHPCLAGSAAADGRSSRTGSTREWMPGSQGSGAQTDLTVGLELGAGDPHSAGGSS